ncbi:MAG TPA: ATP-binding protein, partial [Longimicrobiales bacterium]|nr:ATP-binding protein [Longimicrobiales bacterium]
RLDGVDRDWVETVNRRRVSYRNLRPGRYTFRVVAANAEGEWNDVGAAHTFTILPLFWETRVFRAAVLLAVVALLALLYRRRVRRLQRRQDELMQLVEERTHAEARYRGLFENAADAVFTTDLDGRFTAMNRRAEELTGYGPADMGELNLRRLLPPSEAGERVAREWLAGTADGARTVEIIARDGTRIPVEVSTRIVQDGDVAVGIQALARDVRDRAALERQLRQSQKMQAVGQLAGGIAHDFNNLLTVIRGNGELLLEKDPPATEDRADLEQIVAAAERASALTRQLLAFSRQQVVQPVTVDVNELVKGLERMLHRLIGEDIRIELSLTDEEAYVNADPGQLEQVLVNLAVNARDAMPGGGNLTLATRIIPVDDVPHAPVATETGRCLLLTVSDTGLGMDALTVARIFEPFFTTKDAGKGTGLGLSTVYGIVEQAGGQIVCQSEPGRGTVFRIYLPASAAGEPGRVNITAPRIGNWRGTETILLVEDDAAVRSLTSRILSRFGYTVLETGDGAGALRLADDHPAPIHLLLTDMVMPAMNGREVAERLVARRTDVRVLLMSGYTDDEILRRGMHDPLTAFLQKPFTPDDLGRAVRDALDREPAARRTA